MIKISKIVLEIGEKKIELSLKEVNELRTALDSLLEERITIIPPYYPNPAINRPFWYDTTITCGQPQNGLQPVTTWSSSDGNVGFKAE